MRHSLRFYGRTDGVPFGDVGGFALLVVEAQLGALLAFHVFLRVLALQQHGGVADTVVELCGGADGFGVFQATGFGATGEHGFVVAAQASGLEAWANGAMRQSTERARRFMVRASLEG